MSDADSFEVPRERAYQVMTIENEGYGPSYGPKLPRVFAPVWIGRRFTLGMRERMTGSFVSSPTNKAHRRVLRRRLMRIGKPVSTIGRETTGRVDSEIAAWRNDLAPHLRGMNSHAKKREMKKVDAWLAARHVKEAAELERMRANRRVILAGMLAKPKTPSSRELETKEWPPLSGSPSGTP